MGFGESFTSTTGQVAGNALGQIVGTGMGLLLEHHNDKRTLKMNDKLQKQQIAGEKQLADYNLANQEKLWHDTSYNAQMQEIKKAGLNPALMYGQGGGGGQTANLSGAPSNVNSVSAPAGGHEIMDVSERVLQNQMMAAQIELAKSQANKNNVDAANTAGATTELQHAQTASLTQGIENQKAQQRLTELQAGITEIDKAIKTNTQLDQETQIGAMAQKTQQEVSLLINENQITEAQASRAEQSAAEQLIGLQLANDNQRKNLNLTDAKINEIAQNIAQKWKELDQQAFSREIQANYPNVFNVLGKAINDLLSTITTKAGGGTNQEHRVEKIEK